MVLSVLATLCAGAFMLLMTGLMGVPGLCNFSRALRVGGAAFFWIRCLTCFLSMILLHCCSIFFYVSLVYGGGVVRDHSEVVL
jgi:hypothetical protein